VVICVGGLCTLALPVLAQPAAESAKPAQNPAESAAARPHFDGVYGVEIAGERNPSGTPRWIVIRFYEDGTSVEAEFDGVLADCFSWLTRANERLIPGRWRMDGEVLTVLESTGLAESERSGTIGAAGWATTPTVRVKLENGWQLEPVARVGGPELVFAFRRVNLEEGRVQESGNRRPMFQGFGTFARLYDYDRAGRLKGISDELTVEAVDLDQDPLSFVWSVTSGSVSGEGPKARWQRALVNGRPEPGTVGVEVADGRGGRLTFTWDTEAPDPRGWALYLSGETTDAQAASSGS
jgi:hypothetical protein